MGGPRVREEGGGGGGQQFACAVENETSYTPVGVFGRLRTDRSFPASRVEQHSSSLSTEVHMVAFQYTIRSHLTWDRQRFMVKLWKAANMIVPAATGKFSRQNCEEGHLACCWTLIIPIMVQSPISTTSRLWSLHGSFAAIQYVEFVASDP